jgi:hypothetical protein
MMFFIRCFYVFPTFSLWIGSIFCPIFPSEASTSAPSRVAALGHASGTGAGCIRARRRRTSWAARPGRFVSDPLPMEPLSTVYFWKVLGQMLVNIPAPWSIWVIEPKVYIQKWTLKGINQVNIWTLRGDHVFLRGWPIMTIWWGIVGDYTRIDEPKVTHYTCILFSGLIWAKVDFKRGEGSSKKKRTN